MNDNIRASFDRGIIELKAKFFYSDVNEILEWIKDYNTKSDRPLIVTNNYFLDPKLSEDNYVLLPGRNAFSTQNAMKIKEALLDLKEFDFINLVHWNCSYPTVVAKMSCDFIKISGESYHSDISEFYWPFIEWVKIYLKNRRPDKVRIEFWLTYFNTITMRRLIEILDLFEDYKRNNRIQMNVIWYVQGEDIDSLESGKELQKDYPDTEISVLNMREWVKMNK